MSKEYEALPENEMKGKHEYLLSFNCKKRNANYKDSQKPFFFYHMINMQKFDHTLP